MIPALRRVPCSRRMGSIEERCSPPTERASTVVSLPHGIDWANKRLAEERTGDVQVATAYMVYD
jgi:hypothetical protein